MKVASVLFLLSFMTSSYAEAFKKFKLIAKDLTTSQILFEETITEAGSGSGSSMFGGQPILKTESHGLLKTSWTKDETTMTVNFIVTNAYTAYFTHPETGEKLNVPVYDMDELSKLSRNSLRKVGIQLDRSQDSAHLEVTELNIDLELKNEQ